MTRTTYGPLSIETPIGYEEENLIILKGPSHDGTRDSIVVRCVQAPPGTTLDDLADAEEGSLRQTVGTLSLYGKMELSLGGHRAVVREVGFPGAAGRVRQVQVAMLVDGNFLAFCGSTIDDDRFSVMRERVMRLVSDARLEVGVDLAVTGARNKARSIIQQLKGVASAGKGARKSAKKSANKGAPKSSKKPAAKKAAPKKPASKAKRRR